MADVKPQSLANHARLDPPFHLFLLPLGLAAIIVSVIILIRKPGIDSILWLILAFGFVMIAAKARSYALKVQDRVIRLEELSPAYGAERRRLRVSKILTGRARRRRS